MPKKSTNRFTHYFKPASLKAQMERIAKANGRSTTQEVNAACKEYVEKAEK